MQKKGQVTIFVILGIVIIIFIALIFLLRPSNQIPSTGQETSNNIKEFAESCVDTIGKNALKYIGLQGGYNTVPAINQPIARTDTGLGSYNIAHWYIDPNTLAPNLTQVDKEINDYFIQHYPDCINDFSVYTNEGWEINAEEIHVDTTFETGKTILKANYPVTADKAQEHLEFNSLTPITIPWNVKGVYTFAIEAAEVASAGSLPLTFAEDEGYSMIAYRSGYSIVLKITDQKYNEERRYDWFIAIQ